MNCFATEKLRIQAHFEKIALCLKHLHFLVNVQSWSSRLVYLLLPICIKSWCKKKGDLNLKSVELYSVHVFKSFVSPQMQLYD